MATLGREGPYRGGAVPAEKDKSGASGAVLAFEARELGLLLDIDHHGDPGTLQSIATCRSCGIMIYECSSHDDWRHVPAIEDCKDGSQWIRMRHQD
jgi:hypothetical protein